MTQVYQNKKINSWNEVELASLGAVTAEVAKNLVAPCVLILSGELGAGKTTFAQRFLSLVESGTTQSEESIATSPTYSLINEYGITAHADLYRIADKEEIVHLEIELYLENKSYFLVEWGAQYITELHAQIPRGWLFFDLEITTTPIEKNISEATRSICLSQIMI